MIVPMVVLPDGTAERLRRARMAGGLSSRGLARLAGLAEGFVAQIERGQARAPAFGAINAVAQVLGVSLDWLAGHGDEPENQAIVAAVEAARCKSAPTPEAAA